MTLNELLPKLAQDKLDKLTQYCDLLLDENTRINLTAITERDAVYLKHVVDSLAAVDLLTKNARVVDIGCGAGLPSMPLKIVRDDLDFTLLDSVGKKVNFVNRAIATLGLSRICAHHTRIEEYPTRDFDFCVARAVSRLNVLCEYALPLLKVGGKLLAYKADGIDEEIDEAKNALRILGGRISKVVDFRLDQNTLRKIVVVEKAKATPHGYPRPRNLPRTKPL